MAGITKEQMHELYRLSAPIREYLEVIGRNKRVLIDWHKTEVTESAGVSYGVEEHVSFTEAMKKLVSAKLTQWSARQHGDDEAVIVSQGDRCEVVVRKNGNYFRIPPPMPRDDFDKHIALKLSTAAILVGDPDEDFIAEFESCKEPV